MFYYPEVLHHRGGCFATIWLAATRGKALARREYLRVDVPLTCEKIMQYILVQVPPPRPGLPRPRFSLLLSSHLQYGIIVVFHKQCGILIDELQQTVEKLIRFQQPRIDLTPESRALTLPSAVESLDPFFGEVGFCLPSPTSFFQIMSPKSPRPVESLQTDGHIASKESITLRETEPVSSPQEEYEGAELIGEGLVEMLMEQPDDFLEEMAREEQAEAARPPPPPSPPLEQVVEWQMEEAERGLDEEQEIEVERAPGLESSRNLAGITTSTDQLQVSSSMLSKDLTVLPEEEVIALLEQPEVSAEMTPVGSAKSPAKEGRARTKPRSPSLEPLEPAPSEPRRRRRKQLIFFDESTQLDQEKLKAQIADVQFETRLLEEVIVDLETVRTKSPDTLLNNPSSELPPDILTLWRTGASITPFQRGLGRKRQGEDMEIEEEQEEQREQERHEDDNERMEEEEDREIEALDMASDKELSSREPSGIALAQPKGESEQLSQVGSVESASSLEALQDIDVPQEPAEVSRLGRLEDIPEEIPVPLSAEAGALEDERRTFSGALQKQDKVTFHSLLPSAPSRETVARYLWNLLVDVKKQQVLVRQDKPYGDIFIARGPLFR